MLFKFAFIKQSIKDFASFVISPKMPSHSDASFNQKLSTSIILFILKFAFSVLVAGLIGLFYEPKNLTDQSLSERFEPLLYLIVGGMLLPCYEEIFFRLSLKFKPIYLALSAFCLGYYVCTKFVYGTRLTMLDDTFYVRIATGIFIGTVCFIILRNKRLLEYFRNTWTQKFSVIYYLSVIIFAWLHVFNFELTPVNILLTPILTLPQLFSGLVMGYIRIKFGFIYPLVFHMATNSVLVSLDILLK